MAITDRPKPGDIYEDGTGQRVELLRLTMPSPTWWRVRVVLTSIGGKHPLGSEFEISEWALVTYGSKACAAA